MTNTHKTYPSSHSRRNPRKRTVLSGCRIIPYMRQDLHGMHYIICSLAVSRGVRFARDGSGLCRCEICWAVGKMGGRSGMVA